MQNEFLDDATPTEREAVLLRWKTQNPAAGPEDRPTAEEQQVLLREIRERALAIENDMLKLMMEKMRVRPSGKGKPMPGLLAIALSAAVLALLLYVGATYLRR